MGWIPTYAVSQGVCSKDKATDYGTIYYILVVILRLGVPRLSFSNTAKIKLMTKGAVATSLFCLLLQPGSYYGITAMFGSIAYGLSVSVLYPLSLVIPAEYGIAFRP